MPPEHKKTLAPTGSHSHSHSRSKSKSRTRTRTSLKVCASRQASVNLHARSPTNIPTQHPESEPGDAKELKIHADPRVSPEALRGPETGKPRKEFEEDKRKAKSFE